VPPSLSMPTGLPLAAVASAATNNGPPGNAVGRYTLLLPHLLIRALVVCANIGRLIADAGHDSRDNRECRRRYAVLALIRARGCKYGFCLVTFMRVVENAISWVLINRHLDRRHDRSAQNLQAPLTTASTLFLQNAPSSAESSVSSTLPYLLVVSPSAMRGGPCIPGYPRIMDHITQHLQGSRRIRGKGDVTEWSGVVMA
jgi:hypothetical protein